MQSYRVVKLISPNLNYIMILGAVMIAVCGVPIRTRTIATQTIDCVVRNNHTIVIYGYTHYSAKYNYCRLTDSAHLWDMIYAFR